MTHEEWADKTVRSLNRVHAALGGISGQGQGTPSSPGGASSLTSTLNGAAIAVALAEYCRNNNSTTQSLAIRLANISARYPQRAA